jgi:hypothetical protein
MRTRYRALGTVAFLALSTAHGERVLGERGVAGPLVIAGADTTGERSPTMDPDAPSASRPPPPRVDPIEIAGVRYEQDLDGPPRKRDQPFGYLVAVDAASRAPLWELKVYEVQSVSGLESDVQEVYFTRMERVAGRDELLIVNELDDRYLVDLKTHTARKAPR